MILRGPFYIFFAVIFFSCGGEEGKSGYIKKKKDTFSSQEYAEKVTIEYTDSGKLRARVFTPVLTAVKSKQNPYVVMQKGLKVDFYDANGKLESYMTAEHAVSYTNEKRVVVRRNVEILNTKGETLNTEELIWDQATGTIHTDKFVKITGEDQITTGTGLESNQAFTDWEIINYVGSINLPHDKKPRPRPLISGRGRY